jgi:hypothetical protein
MPKMKGCLEEELKLYYPIEVGSGEIKKTISKITIREMVGYDEEELSQDQYRTNPPLWLRRLMWRCIVDADGNLLEMEDVNRIKTPDADRILVKIRMLSMGNEVEVDFQCNCGYKSKAIVKIDELKFNAPSAKNSKATFKLDPPFVKASEEGEVVLSEGYIELVTDGAFQEEMFKKFEGKGASNLGVLKTNLLLHAVKFKGGIELDEKDFKAMKQKQRVYLLKLIEDNKVGYDFKDSVKCRKCNNTIELVVSPYDFFG